MGAFIINMSYTECRRLDGKAENYFLSSHFVISFLDLFLCPFLHLFIHSFNNKYLLSSSCEVVTVGSSGNTVVNKQTQEELKIQFQILLKCTHPFIHIYFQHTVQWKESNKHGFNLQLAGWSWASYLNSQNLSFCICYLPHRKIEWVTSITCKTAWHFILPHTHTKSHLLPIC